jgi:predicted HD superfamily hydrolase involved in NAD metabolism
LRNEDCIVSALSIPRADEFLHALRESVGETRVRHCVSVAELLWSIAQPAGVDPEKAAIAGLLHDLCKGMRNEELLAAALEYGIEVSDVHRARPGLLHGHVGAEYCRRRLGIEDDVVHEAIAWHVTGRPHYGPLGLALYFADFAEPLRAHPESAEARRRFDNRGLLHAVAYVADAKLRHLEEKGALIDPSTQAFRAWLTEVLG